MSGNNNEEFLTVAQKSKGRVPTTKWNSIAVYISSGITHSNKECQFRGFLFSAGTDGTNRPGNLHHWKDFHAWKAPVDTISGTEVVTISRTGSDGLPPLVTTLKDYSKHNGSVLEYLKTKYPIQRVPKKDKSKSPNIYPIHAACLVPYDVSNNRVSLYGGTFEWKDENGKTGEVWDLFGGKDENRVNSSIFDILLRETMEEAGLSREEIGNNAIRNAWKKAMECLMLGLGNDHSKLLFEAMIFPNNPNKKRPIVCAFVLIPKDLWDKSDISKLIANQVVKMDTSRKCDARSQCGWRDMSKESSTPVDGRVNKMDLYLREFMLKNHGST